MYPMEKSLSSEVLVLHILYKLIEAMEFITAPLLGVAMNSVCMGRGCAYHVL